MADLLALLGFEPKQGETSNVDLILRVNGRVSKGQDYESAQTCNALGILDVARCLAMAGCTREHALAYMVRSAISDEPKKSNVETLAAQIAEDFKAQMQSAPKVKREGKRTGELMFARV